MSSASTGRPGIREQHLLRKQDNSLFDPSQRRVSTEDLARARLHDGMERDDFMLAFQALVQNAIELEPEVLNAPAWDWLQNTILGGRIPVIDHMWQTETSGPVFGNPYGLGLLPIKPGSATIALPVVNLQPEALLQLTEAHLGQRPQDNDKVFLRTPGGSGIADARRLDLHHLGAEISEQGAGERTRHQLTQLEDAEVFARM